MSYNLPLIIFDSQCPMCLRFKQALEFMDKDKTLNFVSVYDDELYLCYEKLNLDDCKKEIHMITKDNILKGSEVVDYLITLIPGVQRISWLLDSKAAKNATNLFYKKINSIRLAQKKGCKTCG